MGQKRLDVSFSFLWIFCHSQLQIGDWRCATKMIGSPMAEQQSMAQKKWSVGVGEGSNKDTKNTVSYEDMICNGT